MRKILAVALALVCFLEAAVSVAQAPPPVPALPDSERRVAYSISAQIGPFSVPFALYGDGTDYSNWVQVFLTNGTTVTQLTGVTDWTLSTTSGSLATLARPITNATITLTTPRTGTLQIIGARRPRRLSQFTENRGVAARDLNQTVTDLVAENRERWDQVNRSIQVIPGESIGYLPPVSVRAGNLLCFDGSGNLSACIPGGAAFGPIGSGNILGNAGGSSSLPIDTTVTALFDRFCSSTAGMFFVRGAPSGIGGVWGCRAIVGDDLPVPTPTTLGGIFSTQIRTLLTADRTYFVRTDGADSNSCLVNTSGGACLTIQGAIDKAVALDPGNFNITIQVADGTYTEAITGTHPVAGIVLKSFIGAGTMTILGNTTTPANVLVSVTGANAVQMAAVRGRWTLNGMKFTTASVGNILFNVSQGSNLVLQNTNFGSTNAGAHINAAFGSTVIIAGNYTISGGAAVHVGVSSNSNVSAAGATVTLTGTPAFSVAFVQAGQSAALIMNGNTYSGAATGSRFNIQSNAVVDTSNGGGCPPALACAYFPGNANGTIATGGQYL